MQPHIFHRWSWRHSAVLAGLVIAALCVAAASVGSALAQSRAAAGSVTYTDASGDSGAAPDITAATVSGDLASGSLTFTVTATGYQPTSSDGQYREVAVWIDTDKNAATGDPHDGTEFGVFADNDPSGFYWGIARWSGSSWVDARSATTGESRIGDTITWRLNVPDLGGATSFNFYVHTMIAPNENSDSTAHDDAPEGTAWWSFDVTGSTTTTTATTTTTTTTPSSAPARTMTMMYWPTIAAPTTVPKRLVAGAHVTVTFRVTRDGRPMKSGKMICDPSVAGRVVPHAESFRNGIARLAFVVPKTAKGKLLKVKVTIKGPSYQAPDGVYVDMATGLTGVVHTYYQGLPATKVATFRVH